MSDNTVSNNGDCGIQVGSSPSPVSILRNTVNNNATHGIYANTSAVVQDNVVTSNGDRVDEWGITVSGNGLTVVDNTLYGNASGIFVVNDAGTTGLVQNNVISRSTATGYSGIGVLVDGDGRPTVSDNVIVGYWVPVGLRDGYPTILPTFTNNTISNSRHEGLIGIYGRLEPGVWGSAVSGYNPFAIESLTVPAGAHFTFPAGAVVKFAYRYSNSYSSGSNSAGGLHLEQGAVMTATGTVDSPVVFTSGKDDAYGGDTNGDGSSSSPGRGDWGSISGGCLGTACSQIVFDHVLVRYGRGVGANGDTDIRNTTIEQNDSTGLSLSAINGANPTMIVAGNTIHNNSGDGVYIGSYSTVLISDTIIESNSYAGVASYGNLSLNNSQVNANNGYYHYAGVYQSGNSATISGCTVNNNSDNGIYSTNAVLSVSDNTVSNNGDCGIQVGSSPSPVSILRNTVSNNATHGIYASTSAVVQANVVTGNGDSVDEWGIRVSGNGLTVMNNTLYGNASGIFVVNDAGTTGLVQNNVISRSTATGYSGIGVLVDGDGRPTVSDNVIVGYWVPVGLRDGYPTILPTFTNNTISNSRHEGLIGIYGRLEPGVWGSAVSGYNPFAIESLTVPAGAHFTFPAGAVVKFAYRYSNSYNYNYNSAGGLYLEQGAVLTATGTAGSPVVFTSGKDDTYGGDTNGDGSSSSPGRGDWGSIYGTCSGTNCSQVIFDHVLVRYGDGVSAPGNTDVRNTTIERNAGTGLSLSAANGADPIMRVEDTTIRENSSGNGISIGSYSTVVINRTIIENNYNGINSYGILSLNHSQIRSNSSDGLYQYGNSANVSDCTMDSNSDGIRIYGGVVMSVRETTISNNRGDGVNLSNADPAGATLTFRNNKVVNNWGDGFELNGTAATIRDNDIANNGGFGINNRSTTITFDGRTNWWGDFSGPYHAVKNPLGIGNRVSDYVLIDPWVGKTEWIAYQTALDKLWTEFFAEPVNVVFGNYTYHHTDMDFPGRGLPFSFDRHYSSMSTYNGPLGYGWAHNYDVAVITSAIGITPTALVRMGTGSEVRYFEQPDGSYLPPAGTFDVLTKTVGGQFQLTFKDQTVWNFDAQNRLGTIVDRNGNTATLNYTGDLLTNVSLPDGRSVIFTYNGDNRLTQIEDPLGRTVGFGYDANGDLTTVTDVRGYDTTFTYDGNHQLLTATDANNHTFVDNTYDSEGRVVEQLDADNNLSTFHYDIGNHQTVVTDALAHPTIYTYDDYKRITQETDALGHSVRYWYDGDNNRIRVENKKGNNTYYAYDSWGNMTVITDALDYTVRMTYDAYNNLLTQTDPNGNTAHFEYDNYSNMITRTDTLSGTVLYTYDTYGLMRGVTDENDHTTQYGYDQYGHNTIITDALGHTLLRTYDVVGRKLSETDENNHTTGYQYDAVNHVTVITDALTYVSHYGYDRVGNQTAFTDTLGRVITVAYDAKNRKISETDPLLRATLYGYDAADNLVVITNSLGYATHFGYDKVNRQTAITNSLGNVTYMAYDAMGNQTVLTDANGNCTVFGYDVLNRLIQVTDAETGTVQYGYDGLGNRTVVSNANNNVSTFIYDPLGRVTSESDPLGHTFQYAYDAVGNRTVITKPDNTVMTYIYDPLDRLITETRPDGVTRHAYDAVSNRTAMTDTTGTTVYAYDPLDRLYTATSPGGETVTYTYDAIGNRTHVVYPDSKTVTSTYDVVNQLTYVEDWAGRIVTYTYDLGGRLSTQENPNGTQVNYQYDIADRTVAVTHTSTVSGTIDVFQYAHDAIGNRTVMTDSSGITRYGYDRLYRVTSVIYPNSEVVTYTYDAMGNRMAMTSTVKGSVTYSYDTADRLLQAGALTFTWDDNGNMLSKGGMTFTWDDLDRLVQVISGTDTITFTYNGDGIRVGKSTNGNGTTYIQDMGMPLPYVLLESTGGQDQRYLYGLDLVADVDSGDSPTYFHYDDLGSTRHLSNDSGQVIVSYEYDIFGATRAITGTTSNEFTFTGEQVDLETGLQFLRARYYDPETGRFLNPDPILYNPRRSQDINRYTYVNNNPIGYIDPAGEYAILDDLAAAAVGAVSSMGAQFVGDVADNLIEGRSFSNWEFSRAESYWASGVSGAVGGVASLYISPVGGGALSGGLKPILEDWAMGKPIDSSTWRRAGQGALLGGVTNGVFKFMRGQNPFAVPGSSGYFSKLAEDPLRVVGTKFLEKSFKTMFKKGLRNLLWPSPVYAPGPGSYVSSQRLMIDFQRMTEISGMGK